MYQLMKWNENMHSDNTLLSVLGKATDEFFNIIDNIDISPFNVIKINNVIAIKLNDKDVWIWLDDLVVYKAVDRKLIYEMIDFCKSIKTNDDLLLICDI